MRRLNLAEKCGVRLERTDPRPLHEITFGGERVFLDPGTLSCFAAESDAERPPITPTATSFNKDSQDVQDSERQASCVSCPSLLKAGAEPVFPPPDPRRKGPSAVCLSITHACNLACRYCYVRAKSPAPATMSRETARGALSLLKPPGPWRIGFFGGEPMLAWDLVREVTGLARERARRAGTRVRFSLTTNGTLLTAERAEFLARHDFSLIVSLDGPRELHDTERVAADGAGSFDRVIAGLRTAAASGLGARTTLRATFPLERPELVRRLEFLNALADDGLARAVSVEPAWPARPRLNHQGTKNTKKALCARTAAPLGDLGVLVVKSRSVDAEYVAAASWMAGRIEAGKRARFHHLEKALSRVLLMRPAGTECGAGFGYVEVSPSGEIHACHKAAGGAIGTTTALATEDTEITENDGNPSSLSSSVCSVISVASPCPFSERLRAPWLDNRWYSRRACRACWARNVCGGGCRAEALSHVGSVAEVWPVACAVKKAQVRAALYVAAVCSRERLAAQIGPRTERRRKNGFATEARSTRRTAKRQGIGHEGRPTPSAKDETSSSFRPHPSAL